MKKTILIAASILAMAGCGNRNANKAAEEDMVENGRIGYADLVSFICQGYECNWADMSPEEQGLSQVYSYSSEYAGFAEKDIDGDGIPELLLGDEFEDGTAMLYDIYTINPENGSLIHLAKGGERDTFTINGAGIIIESGSNSAFDSFRKAFKIQKGKLVGLKDAAWEDSALIIKLEKFAKITAAGAYSDQREMTEEEMDMFRKATADDTAIIYTPLSVSTQVVAGTNYKFYCRFEDKSDGIDRKSADDSDRYGYCWITIFKPLPGQGEPKVSSSKF